MRQIEYRLQCVKLGLRSSLRFIFIRGVVGLREEMKLELIETRRHE